MVTPSETAARRLVELKKLKLAVGQTCLFVLVTGGLKRTRLKTSGHPDRLVIQASPRRWCNWRFNDESERLIAARRLAIPLLAICGTSVTENPRMC